MMKFCNVINGGHKQVLKNPLNNDNKPTIIRHTQIIVKNVIVFF